MVTPGEGWGEGHSGLRFAVGQKTLTLTLSRSTGRGHKGRMIVADSDFLTLNKWPAHGL